MFISYNQNYKQIKSIFTKCLIGSKNVLTSTYKNTKNSDMTQHKHLEFTTCQKCYRHQIHEHKLKPSTCSVFPAQLHVLVRRTAYALLLGYRRIFHGNHISQNSATMQKTIQQDKLDTETIKSGIKI